MVAYLLENHLKVQPCRAMVESGYQASAVIVTGDQMDESVRCRYVVVPVLGRWEREIGQALSDTAR